MTVLHAAPRFEAAARKAAHGRLVRQLVGSVEAMCVDAAAQTMVKRFALEAERRGDGDGE